VERRGWGLSRKRVVQAPSLKLGIDARLLSDYGAVRVRVYAQGVRVVGFDPGLAACGYGVVELRGRKPVLVESGCWHTKAGEPLSRRLAELFTSAGALIARQRPDAVALEESFVGRDARVALSVGQARGALLVASACAGVTCVEYSPASVKQAVCGYGRAEKPQVQQMTKALLGLEATPTPTHAADALAVAICHASAPLLLQLAS
jgi:crossover junction endodeoxyribonuclease RuvC